MEVHRFSNATEFLEGSESWLLQSEAENNLMLGIAGQFKNESAETEHEQYWAAIVDNGRMVGTAFRTPPHPLALSTMPLAAIPMLVDDVAGTYSQLPGVHGPVSVAERFADTWVGRFGGSRRVQMRQRIHQLTAVNELAGTAPGRLRRMEPADATLILEWMAEFVEATGISGSAESFARPHLEQRHFYLWDDGGPKSVAATARESRNGACINAVYTPPIHRRQGYATAAVAALSARLLSTGKSFCCLYTDIANPTSNSIYARVGYAPVREDASCLFDAD